MIQQINVNELKQNPINPRKITAARLKNLQQSVMLFPKMLNEAKLIVIDEDNVVLEGNQRVKVLQEEILAKEPFAWKVVLQDNDRYQAMSENEKEAVVDYWEKWKETPIVTVDRHEGLTEDRKKEVIIKGNREFAEFDYEKAEILFDEVTLVSFGVDEGVFYDPDKDPTVVTSIKGSRVKKIDMLLFGKYSVPVTREEYDLLREKYEEYVDTACVDFGFVKDIVNKLNAR